MIISCGICVLCFWQGQKCSRGIFRPGRLDWGSFLEPNPTDWMRDTCILYRSEACRIYIWNWKIRWQKSNVLGTKGRDQKPFKVRSFTALTSVNLAVCFHTLSGRYKIGIVQKRRGGNKTDKPHNPYFARYQFLPERTIKSLFIDLLIAKQILQVL